VSAAASPTDRRLEPFELDWPAAADPGFAGRLRRVLDECGFAILRRFTGPETQSAYRAELLAAIDQAGKNAGAKKYNLKGAAVAGHAVAVRARGDDLLRLVNALAAITPRPTENLLEPPNVRTGYSIVKNAGDAVAFHFDDLNFLNLIVPVALPDAVTYPSWLWIWPNLLAPGPRASGRWIGRIATLAANSPLRTLLPLKRIQYREGDAVLFYGSRSLHGVLGAPIDGVRAIASLSYSWAPADPPRADA
jgi:hypothetical protein